MPTSPILNEYAIVNALESPDISATALQDVAKYAIIACFDRKVAREFFEAVVPLAIDLHTELETLRLGANIGAMFKRHGKPARVVESVEQCGLRVKALRKELAAKMSDVARMPWRDDKVH